MIKFRVNHLMHLKKEKLGFHLIRENGTPDYVFIHFITPVQIFVNGRTVKTAPNACVIFTPNHVHNYAACDQTLSHNYIHFHMADEAFFAEIGILLNAVFYPGLENEITEAVELIEWQYLTRPEKDTEALIDQTVMSFFLELSRALERTGNKVNRLDKTKAQFDTLRDKIYESPKGWDVERMAAFLWLSRSRFSVLYNQFYAVTPREDLISSSLHLAKKLLSTTGLTISDIAYECGYSSAEYFIRLFKAHEGVTPGMYRKSL